MAEPSRSTGYMPGRSTEAAAAPIGAGCGASALAGVSHSTCAVLDLFREIARIDRALDQLIELQLVALRPWRPGTPDGVWQILPLEKQCYRRAGRTLSAADLLRSLGIVPPDNSTRG